MSFNSYQWYLNGLKKVLGANTFIGNVADLVPTASALATKLNISESDISVFNIIGNDIEAKINVNYVMQAWTNTNITHYIEKNEGRCIDLGPARFANTPQLDTVVFLAATFMGNDSFDNSGLKRGIFPEIVEMGYYETFYLTSPIIIYLPKLKFSNGPITRYAFGGAKNVFIPLAEQIGVTHGDNQHFQFSPKWVNIWAHPMHQTINAGNEEGDLFYARSVKFANINYSQIEPDFFTLPKTISAASIGNVYATVIQLKNDATNINPVEYFEKIKINGVAYPHNIPVDGFISGLTPGTNYTIEAVAVDIYHNKSAVGTVSLLTNATESTYIPNMMHYFRFENRIVDSFGKLNPSWNITNYQNAIAGKGAEFNGTSDFVALNSTTVIGGKSAFTIVLQFKNLGKLNGNTLYGSWGTGGQKIMIRINGGFINCLLMTKGTQSRGGNFFAFSDTASFHTFVFSYDGAILRGYLDAVQSGSTYPQDGAVNLGGETEYIGRERTNSANAIIDESLIFDKALDDTERNEILTKLVNGEPVI